MAICFSKHNEITPGRIKSCEEVEEERREGERLGEGGRTAALSRKVRKPCLGRQHLNGGL